VKSEGGGGLSGIMSPSPSSGRLAKSEGSIWVKASTNGGGAWLETVRTRSIRRESRVGNPRPCFGWLVGWLVAFFLEWLVDV